MIICLSGFVIAGASPTSISSTARNDIGVNSCERMVGVGPALLGGGAGARYAAHQHQLLAQLAPPPPPAPPQLAPPRAAGPPPPALPASVYAYDCAGRSSSSSAESVSSHSASPPPARPDPPRHTRVRTLYACLGESEGELSFEPNQIITNVAASGEPGWLRGTLNGKTGLVPENYIEPLP